MSNASRTRRAAVLGALASVLLGASGAAVAAAQTNGDTRLSPARAQQCYYESCPELESTASPSESRRQTAAEAQERYYSSYGEPEPITAAAPPAPADGTPWLPIVLALTGALAAAALLAAIQRRRLRLRRRVARATA